MIKRFPHPIPPKGLGARVVEIMRDRHGLPTELELESQESIRTYGFNGYSMDLGEEWEHFYAWLLPLIDGEPQNVDYGLAFIKTSDVVRIVDPVDGSLLYNRAGVV